MYMHAWVKKNISVHMYIYRRGGEERTGADSHSNCAPTRHQRRLQFPGRVAGLCSQLQGASISGHGRRQIEKRTWGRGGGLAGWLPTGQDLAISILHGGGVDMVLRTIRGRAPLDAPVVALTMGGCNGPACSCWSLGRPDAPWPGREGFSLPYPCPAPPSWSLQNVHHLKVGARVLPYIFEELPSTNTKHY